MSEGYDVSTAVGTVMELNKQIDQLREEAERKDARIQELEQRLDNAIDARLKGARLSLEGEAELREEVADLKKQNKCLWDGHAKAVADYERVTEEMDTEIEANVELRAEVSRYRMAMEMGDRFQIEMDTEAIQVQIYDDDPCGSSFKIIAATWPQVPSLYEAWKADGEQGMREWVENRKEVGK